MTDPADIYRIETAAAGPAGVLPLTDGMLRERPSGDLFGLSQNVGMGWPAARSADRQFLVLSTLGGVRAPDGSPVALGYHTGHWEVGLLVQEAAEAIRGCGGIPFAGFCSDPCDGRTQGTTGMFDSLPYRNDAAIVLRRLARSLPLTRGVVGVATCDKGLPAMLMAVAGLPHLPGAIVPGGVTLPPREGEDAGRIQTIGTRYVHGQITLEEAADLGCRACPTPRSPPAVSRCGGTWRPAPPAPSWGSQTPVSRPVRSSPSEASPMRSWCTRHSAAPPISCCTCRRSPTPRACGCPPSTTGSRPADGYRDW
jgi:hypothetical protein